MVRRLDAFIVYLEQSLLMEDLEDITDVIILSDHGMLTVTPRNFIDLYAFIDENFCKTYGTSPVLQVVCSDDKIQEAYANLTKAGNYLGTFKAYTDDLLLNRWHVQNSDRFGPIVGGLEFCSVFFFVFFFLLLSLIDHILKYIQWLPIRDTDSKICSIWPHICLMNMAFNV